MPEQDSLQNKSKLWALMIIDSRFDDAQLSTSACRVYIHLCRRSDKEHVAWPGITSMAKVCRMKRDTVIAAIKELEERRFLKVLRVEGKSSNYEILPVHCWTSPKERPVSKSDQSEMETAPVSKMDYTSPKEGLLPVQNGDSKVSTEGVQRRSPGKESSKENKENIVPDRFASEEDVISFVFSDKTCRELQCLRMDARWFWNKMEEQGWHRDAKKKNPVISKERVCRDWMTFDSRPSIKTFRYKNEEHRERWKSESRQYAPDPDPTLWTQDI